jgi:hypothetical protein
MLGGDRAAFARPVDHALMLLVTTLREDAPMEEME